uniref:Uncharacterized protein n=1 Tax=Arundo donax TaxID=35708 RepID=A0A0A9HC18_ARUDO
MTCSFSYLYLGKRMYIRLTSSTQEI